MEGTKTLWTVSGLCMSHLFFFADIQQTGHGDVDLREQMIVRTEILDVRLGKCIYAIPVLHFEPTYDYEYDVSATTNVRLKQDIYRYFLLVWVCSPLYPYITLICDQMRRVTTLAFYE